MFTCEKTHFYRPKKYAVVSEKKVLYKSLADAYNAAPSQRGWGRLLKGRPEDGFLPAVTRQVGLRVEFLSLLGCSIILFIGFIDYGITYTRPVPDAWLGIYSRFSVPW